MENRFKFRIWNGSEMHHNDFVVTATGFVGKITEEFLGKCVFNQEDLSADKECVLMQCTGMEDDKGQLIYEGDIVEIWKMCGNIRKRMVVKWRDTQCSFRLYDLTAMGATPQKLLPYEKRSMGAVTSIKIIGNAYENKELLECI